MGKNERINSHYLLWLSVLFLFSFEKTCYESCMKKKTLRDSYRFPGFTPQRTVIGIFGDSYARVIRLTRRGKKQFVASVARFIGPSMIIRSSGSVIFPLAMPASIWNYRYDESSAGGAAK